MEIVIKPLNAKLDVPVGSNLLDILLQHQIPISYSCMSGRCGTCQCKVIDGDVNGPNAADGRLASSNQVLACMSTINSDCVIEIPEPDEVVTHPARVLKGEITSFEALAHDVRRLRLKTNKPLEFSPGQYVQLQFAADAVRPYSMAGVCGDDELEFHIRIVPDGRVTPRLERELSVGGRVKVSGPLGASYLRSKHSGPMLCIAGGTGLAPMLSVARGALESGMQNHVHFYFGVRSHIDLYGLELLEALAARFDNFRYQVVLSDCQSSLPYKRGYVTDAVREEFESLNGWRVYLAGPPPMVEAASRLAELRGVDSAHIYADAFYPTGI